MPLLFAIKAVPGKETHLKQGQKGPDNKTDLCLPSAFTQESGINCLVRFGLLMLNDAAAKC